MKRVALPGCLMPVVLVIAAIAWFVWSESAITLRYRLTLFVEDNGQVVSGSSVYETVWGGVAESVCRYTPACNGHPWHPTVRGEAVAVDLSVRGVLFALLRYDQARVGNPLTPGSVGNPAALLVAAFGHSIGDATWDLLYRIRDTRGSIDVPLPWLPMFVRFGDLNDPTTVERVNPDDLAASFGPGVRLVRATIEITKEPVTTGIERRLPWLALPSDAQKEILKGPYWDPRDPAWRPDQSHPSYFLLPVYFKAEGELL
jgi:hypothetical protein